MSAKPIILASASPRRLELLRQVGLDFQVVPSDIEDGLTDHPPHPADYAERLALVKAEDIARTAGTAIVIGADTIVVLDEHILNKPEDAEDALRMLSLLQGRTHQVVTGFAVLDVVDGHVANTVVRNVSTDVKMRAATENELRAYIATGEPMDKAGAYAIQGRASVFIEGIVGDYFNVVGLPLFALCRVLADFGIDSLQP